MIAHDFSLHVKRARFDTYYFRLILVLVIPQLKPWFLFLIWNFILSLMLLGLFANKLYFWRSQEILKAFWTSDLVEAGAAQDTGSCLLSTLKMPYHKWEGSLFTLALLHSFTLVKVKEVCLTGWIILHLVKLYSHLKMFCQDGSWHYCSCQ